LRVRVPTHFAKGAKWMGHVPQRECNLSKDHPSGAKALVGFAEYMYGLKPVPFSKSRYLALD